MFCIDACNLAPQIAVETIIGLPVVLPRNACRPSVRDVGGLSRAVTVFNFVSVLYGPFEMIRIYHYCGFVCTTVFDFSRFYRAKLRVARYCHGMLSVCLSVRL